MLPTVQQVFSLNYFHRGRGRGRGSVKLNSRETQFRTKRDNDSCLLLHPSMFNMGVSLVWWNFPIASGNQASLNEILNEMSNEIWVKWYYYTQWNRNEIWMNEQARRSAGHLSLLNRRIIQHRLRVSSWDCRDASNCTKAFLAFTYVPVFLSIGLHRYLSPRSDSVDFILSGNFHVAHRWAGFQESICAGHRIILSTCTKSNVSYYPRVAVFPAFEFLVGTFCLVRR